MKRKRFVNIAFLSAIMICVVMMLLMIIIPLVVSAAYQKEMHNYDTSFLDYIYGFFYFLILFISLYPILFAGNEHVGGYELTYYNIAFWIFGLLIFALLFIKLWINKKYFNKTETTP